MKEKEHPGGSVCKRIETQKNEDHRSMGDPHWYALKIYRCLVQPVLDACGQDDVETYRPMRMMEREKDGGLFYQEEPLVPNLLFVRASASYIIRLQRTMRNRAWAYCYPGTTDPAPIADAVMEMFRLVVKAGAKRIEAVDLPLDKGDRVRVIDGMFKGAEGYIRRVHGSKRLVVTIEGVVAVAVTHIPRQFLEKIEETGQDR